MRQSGINMEQVKAYNRAMIIKYICEHETASRVDIAADCGLTPAAVTQIINELIKSGILIEVGTTGRQKGAGRRKVLLSMNNENIYLYSINIERFETIISIANIGGKVAATERIPTNKDADPEAFLIELAEACHRITDGVDDVISSKIKGASIGIPGIVDIENGVSVKAYGIWDTSVEVRTILSRELGIPVIIQNDVNAFARAELLFGEGRYKDDLLVIKWGQDIGGAIVIDGNIYGNRERKTAEIGHMIVDPNGELCCCGKRGCLETKASYKKLNSIIPFEPTKFAEAFNSAAESQKKELKEAISLFAQALISSCAFAAPETIILGGDLFNSKTIRDELANAMKKYDPSFNEERLVYSKLVDRDSYIGPVAEFLQRAVFGIKF